MPSALQFALLISLGLFGSLPAQSATRWRAELVHRTPDGEVARSVLERRGQVWTGEIRSEGRLLVRGRLERSEAGRLVSYARETFGAGEKLRGRLSVRATSEGFRLREESPLGTRRATVRGRWVRGVLDAAWPEVVAVWLDEIDGGVVPVLDLGTERRLGTVEVEAREGRARFADLEGGGLTYWSDPRGGPLRLALPGDTGLVLTRLGAEGRDPGALASPPPGVVELPFALEVAGHPGPEARLTGPSRARERSPTVLLLADAGPRDRDGRDAAGRDPLLRDLAWSLAQQGVRTLRYAKRPVGASLEDLLGDARAALAALRGRSDLAGGGVGLVGVGEGALLAMRLAATEPGVVSLVLLRPPLQPTADLLERRLRKDLQAKEVAGSAIEAEVSELREGLRRIRAASPADLAPGERLLHDLLPVEPTEWLLAARVPRLVLHPDGDPDLSLLARNQLRSSLALGSAGVPWKMQTLSGADRRFRVLRPGDEPDESSADPTRPRHPALVPFLREHFDTHGPRREG